MVHRLPCLRWHFGRLVSLWYFWFLGLVAWIVTLTSALKLSFCFVACLGIILFAEWGILSMIICQSIAFQDISSVVSLSFHQPLLFWKACLYRPLWKFRVSSCSVVFYVLFLRQSRIAWVFKAVTPFVYSSFCFLFSLFNASIIPPGNIPFPLLPTGTTTKYLVNMSIKNKPTLSFWFVQVIDEKHIDLKAIKRISWNSWVLLLNS